MKKILPVIPVAVENWWEATREAARLRCLFSDLKKVGVSPPPDIVIDWQNIVARVAALKANGADKAASKWCKDAGMVALDPFMGAGASQVMQERRGRDRGFSAFNPGAVINGN